MSSRRPVKTSPNRIRTSSRKRLIPPISPALFLTPPEVAEVASALGELTRDELVARCHAADANRDDLDPPIWSSRQSEWILEVFDEVKAYFEDAARDGQAMFVLMC